MASDTDGRPVNGFLKVSSHSSPASVAGAIAGLVKDGSPIEVQCVGAGAVNQAVKAIAISRGFLAPVGFEVACVPSFADIVIDGQYRTAIRMRVVAWREGEAAEKAFEDAFEKGASAACEHEGEDKHDEQRTGAHAHA